MDDKKKFLFSWIDHVIFAAMLTMSLVIGIYFGFRKNKKKTIDEYLKGEKSMNYLAVALSIIASQVATSTLLAVPVDVYRFGANYMWVSLATLTQCLLGYYIFLPVFFELELTSLFEYLDLRFDKKVNLLASTLNLSAIFIYCPVVIYVASLAYAQVTGIKVMAIASISSGVCVVYTAMGGFRAVIWTDVLQFVIMFATYFSVFCLGLSSVNGFGELWHRSVEGHRLDVLDFRFDPTLRDSFGAIMIGGTMYSLCVCYVDPVSVQKFVSVPTLKDAKRLMIIVAVGMALLQMFAAFTGLLIYTKYWNCDPLSSNEVENFDQLVPYFMTDIVGKLPGYLGIFIAGVFSAAMSTVSASLNTMAAVIYKDYISAFTSKEISEKQANRLLKGTVVIIGTITTALVLLLEDLNGIFPVYTGIMAVIIGPTLGLFLLGVLIPMANSKGALWGTVSGIAFVSFVFVQNLRYRSTEAPFLKPVSTLGCENFTVLNSTTPIGSDSEDLPFFLYRISFWYNTVLGCVATVTVGVLVSIFTEHDRPYVPKRLLCPAVRSFVKERSEYLNEQELALQKSIIKN